MNLPAGSSRGLLWFLCLSIALNARGKSGSDILEELQQASESSRWQESLHTDPFILSLAGAHDCHGLESYIKSHIEPEQVCHYHNEKSFNDLK